MPANPLDWSRPAQGGNIFGVANLTNDPTVRDWANYHNCQCWSPDGRYVCFTRFASDGERYGNPKASEVHIFDLHTGKDRTVGNGQHPRWANDHNWLFYIRTVEGDPEAEGTEVWWVDVEAGRETLVTHGLTNLGGVSHDDAWLFGMVRVRSGSPFLSYRMRIQENAKREYIPGMDGGFQWIANPQHNVVFARVPNLDDEPFSPTRYWCDIDGGNIRVGSVTLERCHQSWLGNGEYYLLGNSQVRGRKWDQPFPSSLHFLANVRTGDISPCGRNGRFVVGDKPLSMADLRSGHGWYLLEDLSIICYPSHIGDNSGPYDSDAKGSPDGTKICFVGNYDLKDGPVTFITKSASTTDTRVEVQSTERFPDSGEIVVFREVISYTHKTPTSFEGLERKRYDTSGFGLREYSDLDEGEAVTPFEARCIPEDQWKTLPLPDSNLERTIGSLDSPLIRQQSTDVWAAIVRLPDRPYLRQADTGPELIPGESHYETFGYHLLKDGQRITDEPVQAPASFEVAEGGAYTAVAVEYCGIESLPSNALELQAGQSLRLLTDAPAGFSWTWDRWFVDAQTVDLTQGVQSETAQRAIYHLYDGPIAREWYNWGALTARHDLNAAGLPTRKCTYHQGVLFSRHYYTGDKKHLSTEYLDTEGNVTEMILYEEQNKEKVEYDHWWYDKGMPVRRIGRKPARRVDSDTSVMYVLSGDRWVQQDYTGKQPQEAWVAAEQWEGT